jgi:hypothetical protein
VKQGRQVLANKFVRFFYIKQNEAFDIWKRLLNRNTG